MHVLLQSTNIIIIFFYIIFLLQIFILIELHKDQAVEFPS